MDSLFDGMADRVQTYIDDTAVYSQTWEQHLQNLKKVFSLLQSAGLTLRTDKCTLGTDSCEFLGHVAGSDRVVPGKDKTESSREFARPQTKQDVRAWLGLTGYYRRFIQEYAAHTVHLTDALGNKKPDRIAWNEDMDKEFEDLKIALTKTTPY